MNDSVGGSVGGAVGSVGGSMGTAVRGLSGLLRPVWRTVMRRYRGRSLIMVLLLGFDAPGSLFLLLSPDVFRQPEGYLTYLFLYCSRMLILVIALLAPRQAAEWFVQIAAVVALQLIPMVRSFSGLPPAHTYITIVMGLSMVVAVFATRRGLILYLLVACPVVVVLVFEARQLGPVAFAEMLYATFFVGFPSLMLYTYRTRLSRATMVAENLARVDPLTGALNRRGLQESLGSVVSRAVAGGLVVRLLIIDLDHFKQVNDRYGHLAGDEVLTLAAEGVRSAIRPEDVLARTGGEEFVVVAAGGAAGVAEFGDRVRCGLAQAATAYRVSASVGAVVGEPPVHGEPTSRWLDDLLGRADAALYEAKRTGRDRVVVHCYAGGGSEGGAAVVGTSSATGPAAGSGPADGSGASGATGSTAPRPGSDRAGGPPTPRLPPEQGPLCPGCAATIARDGP